MKATLILPNAQLYAAETIAVHVIINVNKTKNVATVLVLYRNATQPNQLEILVVLYLAIYAIPILIHVHFVPLTMNALQRGMDQTPSAGTVFAASVVLLMEYAYVQPTLIVRLVKPVPSQQVNARLQPCNIL